MGIAGLWSDKNLLIASLLVFLCGSCTRYDARGPADYIGPIGAEPNAATTNSTHDPNLQAAIPNPQFPEGPLRVTTEQAVLLTLENNRALVVERLNPQIAQTFVPERLAIFDPVLAAEVGYGWDWLREAPTDFDRSGPTAAVGVREFLPGGTTLGVTGSTQFSAPIDMGDEYASTIAFQATQALLQGAGAAVNLASVDQARLDVQLSQYELRGFVQSLVAQVEETYWDYVLAERRIEIYSQSLDLAQKQWEETQERIRVGDLARTELSAAEAEVALRREALINARR